MEASAVRIMGTALAHEPAWYRRNRGGHSYLSAVRDALNQSEFKTGHRFPQYLWFVASTACMLTVPMVIILILNRVGSAEDVGLYSYAYAVTAPLQAFLGFHARAFIAIDRLNGHRVEDFLAQRVYMAGALFSSLIVLAIWHGKSPDGAAVLLAMGLVRVAESLGEISIGVMQRHHRAALMTVAYGVRAGISVCCFAWFFIEGYPLWFTLIVVALIGLLTFFVLDRNILAKMGEPINLRRTASSLLSFKPITLSVSLVSAGFLNAFSVIENNVPRYVLEEFVGLNELGVYTTLGFGLAIVTNLVHPLYFMTFAHLGQLAQKYDAESRVAFKRLMTFNLSVTAVFGILLVLAAGMCWEAFLATLFGDRFGQQSALLIVMAIGAAVGLVRSCLGFILTSLNILRSQSILSVVNVGLFLGLCAAEGRGLGTIGIAWAWVVSSSICTVLTFLLLGRSVRETGRDTRSGRDASHCMRPMMS